MKVTKSQGFALISLVCTVATFIANWQMAKAQQAEMKETINDAFDDQKRRMIEDVKNG